MNPMSCRFRVGSSAASFAKEERLRRWLRDLGHRDLALKLKRFGGSQGYGMIAGESLECGRVLVEVPERAFLSEISAEKCPLVAPLKRDHGLGSWQILCAHLILETSRGEQSFWHPYISMLPSFPEISTTHPLMWPEDQREHLLSGSPMLDKLESRIRMCDDDFQRLVEAGFNRLLPDLSEMDVRWASAILLSRSFSLDLDEDSEQDSLALVPWADMLNHSSSAGQESCLIYDQDSRTAFLQAHRQYSPGDQVYDSYGHLLPATQLFLDYGFVDEENTNHSVDLPTSALGPVRSSSNSTLLEILGLPIETSLVKVTCDGVDESVLAWVRAAIASPEELTSAGWRKQKNLKHARRVFDRFSKPVSRENEAEVLTRLILACDRASSGYPDPDQTSDSGIMNLSAVRAIGSERMALEKGKEVLREALGKLRASGREHSTPLHQQHHR